jgi:hypothetical protein
MKLFTKTKAMMVEVKIYGIAIHDKSSQKLSSASKVSVIKKFSSPQHNKEKKVQVRPFNKHRTHKRKKMKKEFFVWW